jgi:hypothetical protein
VPFVVAEVVVFEVVEVAAAEEAGVVLDFRP